ncbi:MAG: alkylmercury lyase family protein, partial [Thaumarchaeota archaeon]|nr:alkylmercury lyase family protein [Nitrososphaerota archaeon]
RNEETEKLVNHGIADIQPIAGGKELGHHNIHANAVGGFSRLNSELKVLRKYVFDHFFEYSSAPTLEEAMQHFGISRKEAFSRFKGLEAEHHILLVPGTQRILMANPYSALTTPFLVRVGGKHYFANCAWDSVSMHVMLDMDAQVESYCHHCAEPIEISLSNGKVTSSSPTTPVIFLSMPVAKWYDNLVNTCSNNMVYFASEGHMGEWLAGNPGLEGESLTVEKMAYVCRPLSMGRMNLEYERPPKEELMAYWDSIGMKSGFWDF